MARRSAKGKENDGERYGEGVPPHLIRKSGRTPALSVGSVAEPWSKTIWIYIVAVREHFIQFLAGLGSES